MKTWMIGFFSKNVYEMIRFIKDCDLWLSPFGGRGSCVGFLAQVTKRNNFPSGRSMHDLIPPKIHRKNPNRTTEITNVKKKFAKDGIGNNVMGLRIRFFFFTEKNVKRRQKRQNKQEKHKITGLLLVYLTKSYFGVGGGGRRGLVAG